jgi:hypothetical protein
MSKCPLNNFKECYGKDCEFYISNNGCCSFTLTAKSCEYLKNISLALEYLKDLHKH